MDHIIIKKLAFFLLIMTILMLLYFKDFFYAWNVT